MKLLNKLLFILYFSYTHSVTEKTHINSFSKLTYETHT